MGPSVNNNNGAFIFLNNICVIGYWLEPNKSNINKPVSKTPIGYYNLL